MDPLYDHIGLVKRKPINSEIVHAFELALNEYPPDKVFSISGLEIIDRPNIHIGYGNPELAFVFTRYALNHCPNLQACSIVMDAIFNKTIYINTHLKELQLRKDHFITSNMVTEISLKSFKNLELFQFDDYNTCGNDTDYIFI
ncbi:uncharacterized protein EV154DRAFT_476708 [Mucor mucedo]|uniref:uncharacterized protein n=1 Tax=Mucor mucedo TaxID=29922 RepID=UPI002220C1B9|nr:uncharacterized protein EV154DRAFT_476708 [Mucor mucedo]KAI7896343.1 hypothetical protein EV154DRAFT_476708 [Mucor mucedo]